MIITHTKNCLSNQFPIIFIRIIQTNHHPSPRATPEKVHLRASPSDHPVNISSVEISAYKHKNKF